MPRKCCVPNCKSNYKSNQSVGSISTFSFPKDEQLKKQWLRVIPRQDWSPTKYSAVCSLHFRNHEILKFETQKNLDGTQVDIPLKYPTLKPGSVPSIFPNLPKYLSSSTTANVRKNPQDRRDESLKARVKQLDDFMKADIIVNFNDLCDNYKFKVNLFNWDVKQTPDLLSFFILNFEDTMSISSSIVIDRNLHVRIFLKDNELSVNDLKWILPNNLKVSKWSQIENLLARYKTFDSVVPPHSENDKLHDIETFLNRSLKYLDMAYKIGENLDNYKYTKQLEILLDQLQQIVNKKKDIQLKQ